MSKPLTRVLFSSVLAICLSLGASAQPDPGGPPTGPGGDPPTDPDAPVSGSDAEVPFDGGLSLLLAAGAAYGTKKAVDYRKVRRMMDEKA
jgi:hypothetical protein